MSPDDYVLSHIGWNPKVSEHPRATAETLALGLDAFTFVVDDSAQEREFVRTQNSGGAHSRRTRRLRAWRSARTAARVSPRRGPPTSRGRARRSTVSRPARKSAIAAQADTATMMATLESHEDRVRPRARERPRPSRRVGAAHQSVQYHDRPAYEAAAPHADGERLAHHLRRHDGRQSSAVLGARCPGDVVERRLTRPSFSTESSSSCRAMGFQLERAFLRLLLDAERGESRVVGRLIPTGRNPPCDGPLWRLRVQ